MKLFPETSYTYGLDIGVTGRHLWVAVTDGGLVVGFHYLFSRCERQAARGSGFWPIGETHDGEFVARVHDVADKWLARAKEQSRIERERWDNSWRKLA